MATIIMCTCSDCVHNNGIAECQMDYVTISDDEMRADGFYPRCADFDDGEDD